MELNMRRGQSAIALITSLVGVTVALVLGNVILAEMELNSKDTIDDLFANDSVEQAQTAVNGSFDAGFDALGLAEIVPLVIVATALLALISRFA